MKMISVKKLFSIFLICAFLESCSSPGRPNLYPNDVLKERGMAKAHADIDQCMKEADLYLATPEGKKVAKGGRPITAVGIATGLGPGPNGMGSSDGTIDIVHVVSAEDVKRSFVNQCLENKGYQILAWE